MLFVALLTVMAEKSHDAYREIARIKPPSGVAVKAEYALFGRHDLLIIYEASDERASLDFIFELRRIAGIIDSETFSAIDLQHIRE